MQTMNEIFGEKLHEECGVFGVFRRDGELDVVGTAYYGCMPCSTAARRAAVWR